MKLRHFVIAGTVLVSSAAFAAGQQHDQAQSGQQQSSQNASSGASSSSGSQMNMSADMVRQAQQKLTAQGYDPGPVDGKWGPRTQNSVKKFQEDRNLKASGRLDQETMAALDAGGSASTGSSSSPDQSSASGGSSSQDRSSGSSGSSANQNRSSSGGSSMNRSSQDQQ
jgi:peptidoglycan hydrolase-like protein with peptidoglycan-binding domain